MMCRMFDDTKKGVKKPGVRNVNYFHPLMKINMNLCLILFMVLVFTISKNKIMKAKVNEIKLIDKSVLETEIKRRIDDELKIINKFTHSFYKYEITRCNARIALLKQLQEFLDTLEVKKVSLKTFPEPQESEDEKNIKDLIDELKLSLRAANCQNDASRGGHEKRIALLEWAIAWIKKQGKQSKKVSIWKHWKDGIAGNGEGKQIYLIKNGLTYSISSCLGHECDYIELSELDELLREEKQGNKPKWTEEDERNISKCKSVVLFTKDGLSLNEKVELKRWFDSLKQRME